MMIEAQQPAGNPANNRWAMKMNWHDLLFMHWPVPVNLLRPLIPAALEVDTFDGQAWIGVVPFRMEGVRPRFVPSVSCVSDFPEINVRTYVRKGERSGVWFFSLDAANRLAVRVARGTFALPYYDARMSVENVGKTIDYDSVRVHRAAPPANFKGRYQPNGDVYDAHQNDLDYWLTERYCLYAASRRGRIYRSDIHHRRWPLQSAEADVELNTMTEQLGFELPRTKPLLHFAKRLEVVAWRPRLD